MYVCVAYFCSGNMSFLLFRIFSLKMVFVCLLQMLRNSFIPFFFPCAAFIFFQHIFISFCLLLVFDVHNFWMHVFWSCNCIVIEDVWSKLYEMKNKNWIKCYIQSIMAGFDDESKIISYTCTGYFMCILHCACETLYAIWNEKKYILNTLFLLDIHTPKILCCLCFNIEIMREERKNAYWMLNNTG